MADVNDTVTQAVNDVMPGDNASTDDSQNAASGATGDTSAATADTSAQDNAAATSGDSKAATDISAAAADAVKADAAQVLEQLTSMGITPETASQLLEKANVTDRVAYLLANNPKGFLEEIERSNPKAFAELLEAGTDLYLDRNPQPTAVATQTQGQQTQAATDPRVDKILDRLNRADQERQRAVQAQQMQTIKKGYEEKRDSLIGKLPSEVAERDKEFLRLKVDRLISDDPQALGKINKGDYTIVPKMFAKAAESLKIDTKNSQDKATQTRQAQQQQAHAQVAGGAQNVAGTTEDPFDDWDKTELFAANWLTKNSASKGKK